MVAPSLPAGIEQWSPFAGNRMAGGDTVALVQVARTARGPQIFLVRRAAQGFGYQMIDNEGNACYRLGCPAVPTPVVRLFSKSP